MDQLVRALEGTSAFAADYSFESIVLSLLLCLLGVWLGHSGAVSLNQLKGL